MKNILLLTLIVLISGCSKQSQDNIETVNIDFKNLDGVEKIEFNDVFSKIDLIPIKSDNNHLIKRHTKLLVSDSLYYILDSDRNVVNVYNSEGSIIFSTLKLYGKGPSEYVSLTDFIVDQNMKSIEILDARKLKIIGISLDGNITKEIKFST